MQLNLPQYHFKTRLTESGKTEIFDQIRKKYLVLTPEEWVRQNFIQFLIAEKDFPETLISIEKGLNVNKLYKRFDAVVYNKSGIPTVLIEFKAPDVKLDQRVFDQISAYNIKLKVKYLIVSNGMNHYCCLLDYNKNSFSFLKEIPDYTEIT